MGCTVRGGGRVVSDFMFRTNTNKGGRLTQTVTASEWYDV